VSKEYYIYSFHSTPDLMLWWRANNAGYTTRLDDAGRYTEEQVRAEPDYYDNRTETVAVPCDVVDDAAVRVVLNNPNLVRRWRRRHKLKAMGDGAMQATAWAAGGEGK
jgi:hypothetical protein